VPAARTAGRCSRGRLTSPSGETTDFAITLETDPPARRIVELAPRAEELGFGCVRTFGDGRARVVGWPTRRELASEVFEYL
jgi:hypothetical protein